MIKILLFLFIVFYPISSFATIDERKTDVYFANGIKTKDEDARKNAALLEKSIKKELYGNSEIEMKKHIGEVGYAYNSTHGTVTDLFESLAQKLSSNTYATELILQLLSALYGDLVINARNTDLSEQVRKYKESMLNGHKVLVVAHSQGNLFTYEAYKALGEESKDGWMQDYFHAVSIASPGHDPIKEGTPRVSWNNDLVAHIGLYGGLLENPVRLTKWLSLDGSTIPPFQSPMYSYDFQVPSGPVNDWIPIDFKYDSNVHSFKFYMGKELKDNDTNETILNVFTNQALTTDVARTEILKHIKNGLDILETKLTQWQIESENETTNVCEERRAKLVHFKEAVTLTDEVFPFNTYFVEVELMGTGYFK